MVDNFSLEIEESDNVKNPIRICQLYLIGFKKLEKENKKRIGKLDREFEGKLRKLYTKYMSSMEFRKERIGEQIESFLNENKERMEKIVNLIEEEE